MKKLINRKFLMSLLTSGLLGIATVGAQQNLQDQWGQPIMAMSYTDISGSPFLMDAWAKGIVKFADNKVVNGLDLKYDQVADKLQYLNPKGETWELTEPVSEFKITFPGGERNEKLFRAGFKPVAKNTERSFYEILSDGNVKFVKKTIKSILETKEFNSATTVRKITGRDVYYVVKDNQPAPVSKNEKSILGAIGDKNAELSAYIKSNKLNLKEDNDILKLFEYYFEISKSKT